MSKTRFNLNFLSSNIMIIINNYINNNLIDLLYNNNYQYNNTYLILEHDSYSVDELLTKLPNNLDNYAEIYNENKKLLILYNTSCNKLVKFINNFFYQILFFKYNDNIICILNIHIIESDPMIIDIIKIIKKYIKKNQQIIICYSNKLNINTIKILLQELKFENISLYHRKSTLDN